LACEIKKKLDAKVCSFGHITLMLSLHYRENAEVAVWPLTTINSYQVAYASAHKLLTEQRQTHLAIIITQKVTHVTSHHFHFSMCSKCPPVQQT